MKIVFQFNIAIEGDLNQNFRIQCPKQLLYHFCIGLFKIHFYTDVVGCLLARSLRVHIQIFSFVNNNSLFIISILTRFAINQQKKYSILGC